MSGRQSARDLINKNILPTDLSEDLAEIIDLEDGWADWEGNDSIPDAAFDMTTKLLYFFHNQNYLPDALVPSPAQTINFKFNDKTLIVDETETLKIFHHITFGIVKVTFSDLKKQHTRWL